MTFSVSGNHCVMKLGKSPTLHDNHFSIKITDMGKWLSYKKLPHQVHFISSNMSTRSVTSVSLPLLQGTKAFTWLTQFGHLPLSKHLISEDIFAEVQSTDFRCALLWVPCPMLDVIFPFDVMDEDASGHS